MTHPLCAHLPLALAISACLVLGAIGCGGDDANSTAAGAGKPEQSEEPSQPEAPGAPPDASTTVVGGETFLRLDSSVEKVLDLAGVEVAPTGVAEATDNGIRFPISAGALDIDTLSGRVQHEGGLRFTAGGRSVEATDLVVRPDAEVLTAEVAGERIPLFATDFGRPRVPQESDTIVLPATATTLTGEAVKPLNDTLGVDVFDEGLALGDLTISAKRP